MTYRYGFNGKENDNEVKGGSGNQIDFGARVYDSRIGRFLSLDPLQKKYPGESNYAFVSNNPVIYADADGRDKIITITIINKDGTMLQIQRVDKNYFNYSHENAYSGLGYFYKSSVVQHLIIDNRSGNNTTVEEAMNNPNQFIFSSEVVDKKEIGMGEFMFRSLLPGDESGKVKYGYRIYGSGVDTDWQSGLPTASVESESLDLGSWFDFVGGLNPGLSGQDLINDVVKKLGGVNGSDMKQIKSALDIISQQFSNLTDAADKTIKAANEIKKDQTKNGKSNSSDSATCPTCKSRGDSSHIDDINGKGAFDKLKKEGQTDQTKKRK